METDDFGFFEAVYGFQRNGGKGFQWNSFIWPKGRFGRGAEFSGEL
ncbi:MAG: hypothetical protein AAFX53_17440 [Bacteroidota bacterium]